MSRRMGGATVPLVLLVVGLVVVGLFAWRITVLLAEEEPEPTVDEIREAEGIPVVAQEAAVGDLERWRTFTGTVTGDHESVVRARSDDQVDEILAREGETVQEGELVARQVGRGSAAQLRQAEANVRQAQRNVERMEPLHEAGAVSDEEWEDAQTALEQVEAELDRVEHGVEHYAPVTGLVTEVPARRGEIPSPGDPLLRIVDTSVLVTTHRIPPSDADALAVGSPARVADRADAEGHVRRVPVQADPVSRLVEVEVQFPPDTQLRPGSFTTVEVLVDQVEDAVHVPRDAVRDEGVWVVEDDRVTLREVEVGLRGRDRVEVLSGIEAGEAVVVEGAALLSDGALVRLVD